MNKEMLKGGVDRLAAIVAAYLIGKGLIPDWLNAEVTTFLVAIGSMIVAYMVNRPASLVQAANSMPDVKSMKVVTDNPDLAKKLNESGVQASATHLNPTVRS